MPDIVSKKRTEKVVKSVTELTPYMMVEPHIAKLLCEAQLVFPMRVDAATIYPMMEGVSFDDVHAHIKQQRGKPAPAPEPPEDIIIAGMAPMGPDNHVKVCKDHGLKIRKKRLVLLTETECPMHGVKSNMTVLPEDLTNVGLAAIAEASHERRTGESIFTPSDFHPNLN